MGNLTEKGVNVRYAATEAPWMLGKVERHGGLAKAVIRKAVPSVPAVGADALRSVIQEVVSVNNTTMNVSGFSPSQWVLGRNPREPGTLTDEQAWNDIGAMEGKFNGADAFALRQKSRLEAKKAMVKLDTSRRIQKALTKHAAPIKEQYKTGDYVVYRRDVQAGGTKWSTTSTVIGQESAEAIWVVYGGIPVLCSFHSLRPASEEEVLSHCLISGIPVLPESLTEGPTGKRGFVDAREEPQPKARKPTSAARKRTQEEVEPPAISSSSSSSSSDSSSDDEPEQPGQASQANAAVQDQVDDSSDWRVCNEASIDDAEEAAKEAFERSDFRPSTCLNLFRMTPLTSRGKREIVKNL